MVFNRHAAVSTSNESLRPLIWRTMARGCTRKHWREAIKNSDVFVFGGGKRVNTYARLAFAHTSITRNFISFFFFCSPSPSYKGCCSRARHPRLAARRAHTHKYTNEIIFLCNTSGGECIHSGGTRAHTHTRRTGPKTTLLNNNSDGHHTGGHYYRTA